MAKLNGKITSLSATVQAQMGQNVGQTSLSTAISGATGWFGPSNPLPPIAPPGVGGRRWDYPFGLNLQYTPRSTENIGFSELRALADALPVLRAVIETRKDQIAALPWAFRVIPEDGLTSRQQVVTAAQRSTIANIRAFMRRPDGVTPFDTWMRAILEEMLVTDAACIYPRPTLGGGVYSLDVIDGATIKPLVDGTGRRPEPPEPAYQQILKGIVAANFTSEELLYLPRNVRASRVYGFSPVEQIVMTINIALRRDVTVLEHYRSGNVPDSFGTLPKEWTMDQIRQFQDYIDALMSGNTQARSGMRFMPADFKYFPTKDSPLKDVYDEWLARLICYVFSVPPTPFVAQVNRATAETAELQARQEGLVPMQQWIKHWMDHLVQITLGQPEFEFTWSEGDQMDPAVQMQVLTGYVAAGIYSRDEARDDLGDAPIADGTGGEYTVAQPLSPARLPTPEEQAQQHQQQIDLTAAKRPPGGPGGEDGPTDVEKLRALVGDVVADILAKEWDESKHPRGQPGNAGQFAPKTGGVPGEPKSKDMRPRNANGQFVYAGGASRGPTSAAGRRNRLIEGIKNAVERATVGGALIGGSMLAATVFAPEAGAAALTIGIARAVGIAAVGEAATAATLSGMEFLGLPESIRSTVHTAVTLALGAYGVASAKESLDTYMRGNYSYRARVKANGGPLTTRGKKAKKGLDDGNLAKADVTAPEAFDAIKAALYHYGQMAIERLKAEAAAKAGPDNKDKLAEVDKTLDEVLLDFLDHVDRIDGAPEHPEGGDRGSAKEHPVEDGVGKLAKQKDDPWRFTEGGAQNSLDKRDVSDEARDADGKWTAGGVAVAAAGALAVGALAAGAIAFAPEAVGAAEVGAVVRGLAAETSFAGLTEKIRSLAGLGAKVAEEATAAAAKVPEAEKPFAKVASIYGAGVADRVERATRYAELAEGSWAKNTMDKFAAATGASRLEILATLDQYQAKAGGWVVNAALRAADTSSLETRANANIVKRMDEFIRLSPTSEDLTLYRGIESGVADKVIPHLKPGSVLKDAAFTSSTTDKNVAKDYATSDGKKGYTFEIIARKGSHVLPLDNLLGAHTGLDFNREYVFGREASFKVISVSKIFRRVKLEHI